MQLSGEVDVLVLLLTSSLKTTSYAGALHMVVAWHMRYPAVPKPGLSLGRGQSGNRSPCGLFLGIDGHLATSYLGSPRSQ